MALVKLGREAAIVRAAGRSLTREDPFWPAQLTAVAAIALYFGLSDQVTIGPTWVLPAVEALLVVGLIVSMPHPAMQYSPWRRHLALTLIAVVSVVNLVALVLLTHYLLRGGDANGRALLDSGVVLWLTNVLVFALWFWELDRDGPVARALADRLEPDFVFPAMTDDRWAPAAWRPSFWDYLYLSLTNATAFSPTDTVPLTGRAKLSMAIQSLASLVTIGLIVARAVNVLA